MADAAGMMDELSRNLANASQDRRDNILIKMSDLFEGVSHLLDDGGVDTFDSIFVSLIPTCSDAAKSYLSTAIAPRSRAPGRAVRSLAFDDSIIVARPVIRLSPLLLDDHLLALATVKSLDHLMAMCARSQLSPGVTDVILSRSDGALMVALVSNPGAELSEKGQARIAEAALDDGELYDIVQERADLAPRLALIEGRDGPSPQPIDVPAALPALDQALRDLLRADRTDVALGQLAVKVGAPAVAVAKAFALDVHGGFLAYARAAPIQWDTALHFLMKRYAAGHVTPRLQRAEADFQKISIAEARRVVALLAKHAPKPS
jgi:hypothetical protein